MAGFTRQPDHRRRRSSSRSSSGRACCTGATGSRRCGGRRSSATAWSAAPSSSSPGSSSTTCWTTAAARGDRRRRSLAAGRPVRARRRDARGARSAGRHVRALPDRIAARSWACTRSSWRSARSPARSSAASPPTGWASTACSSPRSILLGIAVIPLARLRAQEHKLVACRSRTAWRDAGAGVTDGRPWVPVPLARGTPRRGRRAAPPRDARPGWRSCGPAARRSMPRSRRTPCWASSCPSSCGIGGDAFWLIWDAAAGRQVALNGSGRAPAGADAAALRRAGHDDDPAARPAGDHGAGRGPLVGRRPRARSAGCRAARPPRPRPSSWPRDGFPASDALRRRRRADRAADRVDDRDRRRRSSRVYRPFGRPWRPGERVRHAGAGGDARDASPTDGFEAFYEGDLGERQARGLAAAGCPITVDDLRDHTSTWTDPIAIDYRGVRVTTHPPNSSGIVALEMLAILAQLEPPGPAAFGPDGVTDPAWIHARHRGGQAGDGRSRRAPDRPGHSATSRSTRLLDPAYAAELAARIDPRRAAGPAACHEPVGWRHGLSRRRRPRRQRGQPHPVELYGTFGSGVARPGHRGPLPEPGQLLQPRPRPPERPRAGQADAPHAAPRDAVP